MTEAPSTTLAEAIEAAAARLARLATADPADIPPGPLPDLGMKRSRMLSVAQVQRLYRKLLHDHDRAVIKSLGADLRLVLADRARLADELALAYGRAADEAATTQAETTQTSASTAAAAGTTPPDLPLPDDAIGRCDKCRIPLGVNADSALLPGIVTPAGLRCPVCIGITSAEELRAELGQSETVTPTQTGATSE